ncbi:MAG TPA: hypothetical protein VF221_08725 [Chloroflexota bacterium]
MSSPRTGTSVRTLPFIGQVVIGYGPGGLVISDRATHGRRFALSGMQAGECMSYLKANPTAAEADVRAACPGRVVATSTS